MATLLISVGLFLLAVSIHVVVWRIRVPRNHTLGLLVIFALVPLLVGAAAALQPSLRSRFISPRETPSIALFYLGAVGCYLITYAGVEETSPSLKIIRALEAAADAGCTREELAKLITEEQFIAPRLQALKLQGITAGSAGVNQLTDRGILIARSAALLAAVFRINESV